MGEEKFEDEIIAKLLNSGWKVKRQVECDESKNWDYPWRADLIISHPSYQQICPIGIELKYIRGSMKGSIFANAFKQICKYKDKHFDGIKISTWVVGAKYSHDNIQHQAREFTKAFMNKLGIGWLEINHYRGKVHWSFGEGDMKITLWDKYNSEYPTNCFKIYEFIQKSKLNPKDLFGLYFK